MQTKIILTKHAKDKAKQRLGLNASALGNLAYAAFTLGTQQINTKGKLKKFLEGKHLNHNNNDARVYGENVFFFTGTRLITVYQLPNDLRKYVKQKAN